MGIFTKMMRINAIEVSMSKVYYVELNLSGVIKVKEEFKQELIDNLQETITKFISQNQSELIRVENSIDIVGEEEIMRSFSGYDDEFN